MSKTVKLCLKPCQDPRIVVLGVHVHVACANALTHTIKITLPLQSFHLPSDGFATITRGDVTVLCSITLWVWSILLKHVTLFANGRFKWTSNRCSLKILRFQ